MKKTGGRLKKFTALSLVVAVMTSILAGAVSAQSTVSVDDSTTNIAIVESLLNDRQYVVDTFTTDTLPVENPYARLNGLNDTDYLKKIIWRN